MHSFIRRILLTRDLFKETEPNRWL